ncbi:reverse transcriptase domain-containing protein [[Clostridium] polysaccharolyticum]|uniref:reverse transcriptase domain-containing protein n=1 Tax=[Clostridium] polysaccharolyticum TaxID=29364 RepID=UPI0038CD4EB9
MYSDRTDKKVSKCRSDGKGFSPTLEGVPQGGNLSPLISNIMLNELDMELERRGLRFCRYADDCNVYVKSKKSAERVMKSITKFIEKYLARA